MTNIWDLILTEARDPDVDASLAEETRRLMRLVQFSDRHSALAAATSNVVSKEGSWDDVSAALCGSIHAAMLALATLQGDPEAYLSDYLRPHPGGQPWTWPQFVTAQAVAAGLVAPGPASRPADSRATEDYQGPQELTPTGLPKRQRREAAFVPALPPAAAGPAGSPEPEADAFRAAGLQVLGDPSPFFAPAVRPVQGLPENFQVQYHGEPLAPADLAMLGPCVGCGSREVRGGRPVHTDRCKQRPGGPVFSCGCPAASEVDEITTCRVDPTKKHLPELIEPSSMQLQRFEGGIPPMVPPEAYGARGVGSQVGLVRPLSEIAPGVHFAQVDPDHVDRDSA